MTRQTNESFRPAKYAADKDLQKIIEKGKTRKGAKILRLPSPWRENVNSFSVDQKNFVYLDNQLVIPTSLRAAIMGSLPYEPIIAALKLVGITSLPIPVLV